MGKVLGRPGSGIPPDYHGPRPDDFDFYSEFDLDDIADESLRELARRARDAGREVTLGLSGLARPLIVVGFPAGRTSRSVTISNGSRFPEINFAEYEFVGRYEAVWNKRSGTVEAKVQWAANSSVIYILSRSVDPAPLVVTGPAGAQIRFGEPSAVARALLRCDAVRDATLTLTGMPITSCEDAAIQLDSTGAAFLFQLDLSKEYRCSLAELPVATQDPMFRLAGGSYRWDLELAFPRRSIPPEPRKLYYYAGTLSDDYPSLRFLAYYQVLEYFFVRYSGARRRGFRSEREQLRAKVLTCVDPGALRGLLTSHQHDGVPLGRHLADPRCLSGVSLVDAGGAGDDELLTALANRIYGIRNRIVHAKQSSADHEPEPLFPFSAEAAALLADIEVLRYVAASVLIESAVNQKIEPNGAGSTHRSPPPAP